MHRPTAVTRLRFDAAEFAEPQLGFIVENVMLQAALLEVLRGCDVEMLFDTPIESWRFAARASAYYSATGAN